MPPRKRKAAASSTSESEYVRFSGYIQEEHKQPIYSISFYEPLPDGEPGDVSPQFFASVGANRATIYRLDEEGCPSVAQAYVDEDVQEILYASAWTSSLANTPLLAVAGFRGLIKVLDCQTGELVHTLVGHGNAVNEMRIHPLSPALLFSVSKDESVRLWNIYTQACIAIFAGDQGHRDEVLSCDVHLLGNCLASCGMDNTVKLWSLDTDRIRATIDQSYSYSAVTGGIESSDPDQSTTHFRTLFEQFPIFSTSKVHSDYVDCVRWVGNLLTSKSTASKIVLWKPDTYAIRGLLGVQFEAHAAPEHSTHSEELDSVVILHEYVFKNSEIWFVRFGLDPQLEYLGVGTKSGKLWIWGVDGQPAQPLAKNAGHPRCTSTVRQVTFSPDSRFVLCGCEDGTIWRWTLTQRASSALASAGTMEDEASPLESEARTS